jgi:hypothetical protein
MAKKVKVVVGNLGKKANRDHVLGDHEGKVIESIKGVPDLDPVVRVPNPALQKRRKRKKRRVHGMWHLIRLL